MKTDLAIIGAGPAGLAAAIAAKEAGVENVEIIEREGFPGGILNQCIHDGFGVIKFKETLTGPEYAHRYINLAKKNGVKVSTDIMVADLNSDRKLTLSGRGQYKELQARAVILAMGCRERTRGALGLPGTRPAGIFTAGVVQHLVNLKNIMIGKRVIILGSGDIGLIMARRLTLEGAKVEAVVEKLPFPSGLPRNLTQCLEDFGIPLLLEHTVSKISGHDRVESVTVSRVDKKGDTISKDSITFPCDTLVLSVGLIPENELSLKAAIQISSVTGGPLINETFQTRVPGIFSCGNALQVHDLVDHVSDEGESTGTSAANFIRGKSPNPCPIMVDPGNGIRHVIPNSISGKSPVTFSMRVTWPTENVRVIFRDMKKELFEKKFRRVNPAEMLRIKVPAQTLADAKHISVEIAK